MCGEVTSMTLRPGPLVFWILQLRLRWAPPMNRGWGGGEKKARGQRLQGARLLGGAVRDSGTWDKQAGGQGQTQERKRQVRA